MNEFVLYITTASLQHPLFIQGEAGPKGFSDMPKVRICNKALRFDISVCLPAKVCTRVRSEVMVQSEVFALFYTFMDL